MKYDEIFYKKFIHILDVVIL